MTHFDRLRQRLRELTSIFPANINVAVNNLPPPGGLPAKPWYVWSRLLFQPIYIGWIWYAALAQG